MSEPAQLPLRSLAELVEPVDDKIAVKKNPNRPYVGLEHIGQRNSQLLGWAPSEASVSVNSVFEEGDILFGKLRPNLRKCVSAPFAGYCSTDILVLRARGGNDPRFAARVFQTEAVGAEAERTSMGTKMPRTSWKGLSHFSVPIPDPEHQSKIAEILDTLDAAIRGTEAVVAKLRAMKQGLLHDLLTRGMDANGDLRPPQPEAPHLYHQTPLGWLPKEWEETDVFGVSTTVTSGSRDWARYYSEAGAVFVRIGNLTREHVNLRLASLIYVRPPSNADGQRTSLEEGDVLVSITADLGIVGVIPAEFGEAYINQHVALIRPNKNLISSRFLGHFLASPVSQNHLSKLNDAGAKAGLNLPTIRGLPVLRPDRFEQDQIAERLDEIDSQIESTQLEAGKLKSLKSGLMDDLLTGRTPVTALL
ncbi:restriction endonuclease subunit S [Defluviimonas sp. WL0024]|uniref:Restriction endonuclease subunit S n=1 Tax=Albidovulum salinarum TaxID=2984153 RepID=A0ABT2X1L9_9RHOB|nr:restriction endonuclease subunit S [Defluviimonas sp. WL0024]MCU9847826.1 restriction endonuclease subunit S [Defluviimonas sp. WL0024]